MGVARSPLQSAPNLGVARSPLQSAPNLGVPRSPSQSAPTCVWHAALHKVRQTWVWHAAHISCCFPSAVSMLSDYEVLEFVWLVQIYLIPFAKAIIVLNFEDHYLRSGSYLLNNVVNRHGARADSVRKIAVSYYYYYFSNKHLEICSCASGNLAAWLQSHRSTALM